MDAITQRIRNMHKRFQNLNAYECGEEMEVTHDVTDRALQELDERIQSMPKNQYLILRHMLYQELCFKVAEFHTFLDVLCGSTVLEEAEVLSSVEQYVTSMTRILV